MSLDNLIHSLNVDLDKVSSQVELCPDGEKPLPEFEYEDARSVVWRAAEQWLERDVNKHSLLSVEQEFKFEVAGVQVHGFTDLRFADEIIDWKTSRQTLDNVWRQRLIDSWQWRIYSFAELCNKVSYRGINRKGECKEITLNVPDTNLAEVYDQVIGLGQMRMELVNSNLSVWPRNSPNACFAYGETCPYYVDCQGYTMPKVRLDHAPLSYSQMNSLMLCPEKTRRNIINDEHHSSEESRFGSACHRGLAELYRQAFKLCQ